MVSAMVKRAFLLVFFSFLTTAFLLAQQGVTDNNSSGINSISKEPYAGEMVEYGYKNVKGYLSLSKRAKKNKSVPAIVLIHEWWGLNDDIKLYADRFAQKGYAALAIDLYEGKNTTDPKQAGEFAGKVRENNDPAFANINAALDFLRGKTYVDNDRMAAVGWCFGGTWSYRMALNDMGVRASVIYYGAFQPEDDLSKMRATILGHFAEKDTFIKIDDVKVFSVKLANQNRDHDIFIYPNTTHGVARQGEHANRDDKAAKKAWKRTLRFLKKNLD